MYNHHLDTFALVAELQSFSAAATKLYISPSAVNQQMTALESTLDVKLFHRSRQGLQLTAAGEYLKTTLPAFREHAERILEHLHQFKELPIVGSLKIGLPHMHTIHLFYNLWSHYTFENPTGEIQLVASNTWRSEEVYESFSNCDLVEYPNIHAIWMKNRSFLKLVDMPIAFAIPQNHPLYGAPHLSAKELKGYTIAVPQGDLSNAIQPKLSELKALGAILLYLDGYSPDMLDNCLLHNWVMPVLGLNPKIPPQFRAVPVNWDLTVPYGFCCKKPASPALQNFLDFAAREGCGSWMNE